MVQASSKKDLRFVIIGGGMAGILSAIKLQQAGLNNFTLYEKGEKFGGTWRENTYPGIACDVPSHLYSYSFAPNPNWSHVCSPGQEILEYFETVANQYGLLESTKFRTEITKMEFSEGQWHLETDRGESDVAHFVIAASGVLHHPSYPDIAGLDEFEGTMFHSARWDHSIELEGKRVGVIGSGSTAIQIVGALAGKTRKLTQFQRTPQWIMPQDNFAFSDDDKQNFRDDPEALPALRKKLAAVTEGGFSAAVVGENPEALIQIGKLCRENLESSVLDRKLRGKLQPSYQVACKRLIISPNYYPAIQHPDAELVTESIKSLETTGVRTVDGKLHEIDVLVLATGFQVDKFLRPTEVVGRDGITLEEAWKARPSAYLSVMVPEFPNLVLLNGPNGPVGNFSLIDVAELQVDYFMQLVDLVRNNSCTEFSATAESATRVEAERVEATKNTVWVSGCNSWYLDDRGIPAAWPWGMQRFRDVMSKPALDDFELVLAAGNS